MPGQNKKSNFEDILAVIAREKTAVESGNISEYLSILSDDAQFLPPNSFPKDNSELRTWLNDFTDQYIIKWLDFTSLEIEVIDDLAYHIYCYRWSATPRKGGQTNISTGKGIHILRKEHDGAWRITREIWNSNPPV
jgi:ketosteroid isomerase-like protein